MPLHIQIVTPEKIILDTQADEIIAPTITGEIAILPHHIPLLTQLEPGELTIKRGSAIEHFVVVGGFLEVGTDTVSILADYAVHGKDISEAKAEEAKQRAQKRMEERKSDEDFAIAEAEFRRAILELKVAQKIKRTS
jgi:F-type H+-transporting ATPase subunit epsilon